VHGYFVNANDFFFYRGDTDEFNQFLQQYARLKKTPLTVVLQPGPGKTNFITRDDKEIAFDWKVDVYCRGWAREIPPDLPGGKSQYVAIIQLHTGGQVELGKIKVPLNVRVKYAEGKKELTEFAAAHEAKRKPATQTQEKPPATPAAATHEPAGEPGVYYINLAPYLTAPWTEYHGGEAGSDLPLEVGGARIGDALFRIGKGVVQLGGPNLKDKPTEVKGIKVGLKFKKLHVLHGVSSERPEGTRVGTYVIHYGDSSTVEIPVEYGVHMRDWLALWRETLEVSGAQVAWLAIDPLSPPARLYSMTWDNPHPDKAVTAIDFNSAEAESAPFVVAMTAEEAVAVATAEASVSPDYKSKRPRFVKLPLNEDGSKVLLVTFDESKGTATGYDVLLADLDFDGKVGQSERMNGTSVERNGKVALSSFAPVKLDVPYKADKSALASWQVAFSYQSPREVQEAIPPAGERGTLVPRELPIGTFHITANLLLRQDSTDWRYFLSGELETSESPETAPVWNINRGLKFEVTTRPDGRNKGNLGIGIKCLVGEDELRGSKAGQPIKAQVEIKKSDGSVVHKGEDVLDKFVFG
jgi:hypothetical protein